MINHPNPNGPKSLQEVIDAGGFIFTPGTPEQKLVYKKECIRDGSAHLIRDDLNEGQKKYLQKLVRIKRGLVKSRSRRLF